MDQQNDQTQPKGTAGDGTPPGDDAGAELNVVSAPTSPAGVSSTPQPEAHTLQKVFYQQAPQTPGDQTPGASGTAGTPDATAAAAARPHTTFTRSTVGLLVGGVAAFAIAVGGGGFALGASVAASNASTSSAITATPQTYTQPNSDEFLPTSPFGGESGSGATGGSGTTNGSGGSATAPTTEDTSTAATAATDEQTEGVVTIVSTLYYDATTQAAGTGVILTSDGQILTNNHVIDGATSIEVTVESTGKTYSATVVGTDATDDVALLQLDDASGLDVSSTSDDSLAVGDEATSIGNAEGTGNLVAAAGTITALDESITVGNEYTGASESLSGLIEVDADVVSGDSGGPLVDDDGDVIGIVTAASSGSTNISGYAIPIETALSIVEQINSGVETSDVSIGAPAFLGVQLSTTQAAGGVAVGGVIEGTPAATAGLAAGDTITAVDGTAVATSDALSELIATYEPGETVTVTYTTAAGVSQDVSVTLMEGPAA
jgi:S1-C subfamily serine protease